MKNRAEKTIVSFMLIEFKYACIAVIADTMAIINQTISTKRFIIILLFLTNPHLLLTNRLQDCQK